MGPGTIYEVAEAHREALARREQQALAGLIRQYGDIWKALKAELDRLQADHAARIARGDVPSPAWLYQEQRSRALLAQVEAEVSRWAGDVEAATRELQRIGAMSGQQYTQDALAAALQGAALQGAALPGVAASFDALPAPAIEAMVGFLGDGSPLGRLFDRLGPDVRAEWEKALLAGIAAGQNPRRVAEMVRRATGMGLARATRIARTEMLRAYREASHQTAQANSDVLSGWRWGASLSIRTCASCLAMHGTFHPLDERLEDHPNGRCTQIWQTKTWAELGISGVPDTRPELPDAEPWLRGLPPADQKRILGKRGAALWRDGQVALHEFTERKTDPEWGAMRVQKPLGRILADKQARWAGLARGDAGGIAGVLEHFGYKPVWSGKSKIETSLFQRRVGAAFDAWPAVLPSGRLSAGRRDLLVSPETAADIAARRPEGISQALHELFHASSAGLSKGLYRGKVAAYRWVEELGAEYLSHKMLNRVMRDIGARAGQAAGQASARSDQLHAFVGLLRARGLTDGQVDAMLEAGMRAPLRSRRVRWVHEVADMLGVRLSRADRIVREALREAQRTP